MGSVRMVKMFQVILNNVIAKKKKNIISKIFLYKDIAVADLRSVVLSASKLWLKNIKSKGDQNYVLVLNHKVKNLVIQNLVRPKINDHQ